MASEARPAAAAAPSPAAPPTRWRGIITGVSDAGEIAKLVALLLAVIGVLAIYFPGLRQSYERLVMPAAWYNVVLLSDPWSRPQPFMGARPRGFESPAWSDGLNAGILYSLPGQMIYSSNIAVGRKGPGPNYGVTYIYDKNVCLHVLDLSFAVTRRNGVAPIALAELGSRGIDAHARLVARLPPDLRTAPAGSCAGEAEARAARESGQAPKPICPRISVWAKAKKISC